MTSGHRQAVAVLVQNAQALLHQYVVVRNIPGGCLEFFNTCFFCKCDPDFRDQYALKVKTCEFHNGLLSK